MRRGWIGAGLAGIVVAVMAHAQLTRPLVVAHRGGAGLAPENSLAAFRQALDLGVDALELDVHLSRDGELVVIHDPTLERTTSGSGPVAARPWADLAALRLKSGFPGRFQDERLPRLDDVLALAAGRPGLRVQVEIKGGAGDFYPGIEAKVVGAIERRALADRVIAIAFEDETLRRLRALRPSLTTYGLTSPRRLDQRGQDLAGYLAAMQALGVAGVGLDQRLVTLEVVAEARRRGLRIGAWTVNDPEAMRRFAGMELDFITTDRPDLLKAVLSGRP
jgi:glycerophosphoryl diester phosphodiesterase